MFLIFYTWRNNFPSCFYLSVYFVFHCGDIIQKISKVRVWRGSWWPYRGLPVDRGFKRSAHYDILSTDTSNTPLLHQWHTQLSLNLTSLTNQGISSKKSFSHSFQWNSVTVKNWCWLCDQLWELLYRVVFCKSLLFLSSERERGNKGKGGYGAGNIVGSKVKARIRG